MASEFPGSPSDERVQRKRSWGRPKGFLELLILLPVIALALWALQAIRHERATKFADETTFYAP